MVALRKRLLINPNTSAPLVLEQEFHEFNHGQKGDDFFLWQAQLIQDSVLK